MRIYHSIFERGKVKKRIKAGAGKVKDREKAGAGKVKNAWTLRLIHIDECGRKISKTWQYPTRNAANDDLDARKKELLMFVDSKDRGVSDVKTFREWVEFAKKTFYKPAVFAEGRKVEGVKAPSIQIWLRQLVECFGDKPLARFTRRDLDYFKGWRLKQGNLTDKSRKLKPEDRQPVKLSTVNRGLVVLRHLLVEAYEMSLIANDPVRGSKAIDRDAESARTRTLSDAEEIRLLATCVVSVKPVTFKRKTRGLGKTKEVTQTIRTGTPHLKAIILLALDSGLRRGEILSLDWKDVDFENRLIKILGTHTKTQKTRLVPMTERTRTELRNLPNFATDGKVFPFTTFQKSWRTALKLADIHGMHFHDLRRTFITRLQANGVTIRIAAELAGHERIETTSRIYTSLDDTAIIHDAAKRINAANEARMNHWPDTLE
ncbi:MAG: site-specific integrase [Acidobacteria bacterium]|nr:site-specific integrase [Acidobacteriota bacterium]